MNFLPRASSRDPAGPTEVTKGRRPKFDLQSLTRAKFKLDQVFSVFSDLIGKPDDGIELIDVTNLTVVIGFRQYLGDDCSDLFVTVDDASLNEASHEPSHRRIGCTVHGISLPHAAGDRFIPLSQSAASDPGGRWRVIGARTKSDADVAPLVIARHQIPTGFGDMQRKRERLAPHRGNHRHDQVGLSCKDLRGVRRCSPKPAALALSLVSHVLGGNR